MHHLFSFPFRPIVLSDYDYLPPTSSAMVKTYAASKAVRRIVELIKKKKKEEKKSSFFSSFAGQTVV